MPSIVDDEFGKIVIRRSRLAKKISVKLSPDGNLRASLPYFAPTMLVKRLIKSSREEIREMIQKSASCSSIKNGMKIGKSHFILTQPSSALKVSLQKQFVLIKLPAHLSESSPEVIKQTKPIIIKALRLQAKSYLPRRLKFIANEHDFSYKNVRFSHASSRWGSCSSSGTISLNIALMQLPTELIDYVLVHELCHTKQMNHSPLFWGLVESILPNYKQLRQQIKKFSPTI